MGYVSIYISIVADCRNVGNSREYPVPDAAAAGAENRTCDFQKTQVRFCKMGHAIFRNGRCDFHGGMGLGVMGEWLAVYRAYSSIGTIASIGRGVASIEPMGTIVTTNRSPQNYAYRATPRCICRESLLLGLLWSFAPKKTKKQTKKSSLSTCIFSLIGV